MGMRTMWVWVFLIFWLSYLHFCVSTHRCSDEEAQYQEERQQLLHAHIHDHLSSCGDKQLVSLAMSARVTLV